MKIYFTFLTIMCSCFFTNASFSQTKRYVKTVATGLGNGSSWSNASADLQGMLNASAPNDEVWVAKGTYRPTVPVGYDASQVAYTDDRHKSFYLPAGVKLYGAFGGTEVSLSQRKFDLNKTVLSGDFLGNDIGFTNNSENAYHVIILKNPSTNTAIIDGFTITGGNTTGLPATFFNDPPFFTELPPDGAGIYANGTKFNLFNCLVLNNYSTRNGGAVYNYGYAEEIYLMNSVFLNNRAVEGSVLHCGDGWHSQQNYVYNCTMVNNISNGATVFKNLSLSSFSVYNSIIWNNIGTGLQVFPAHVNRCIVQDLITNGGGSGNGNSQSDPQFTNLSDPDGADNILGTSDDGLIPQCGPAIGGGLNLTSAGAKDIRNAPRIQNGTVDMGAYETSLMQPVNSLMMRMSGNMATWEGAGVAGFCEGRYATFYVETGNGGVYQWKRNGINVGTNSYLYSTTSLDNGDVISVTLTSPAGCGPANVVSASTAPLSVAEAIPGRPAQLFGPTNPCPYINGPPVTYYINKVPHAQYYHWSVVNTQGVTITHPNGTGINDTVVLVTYHANFAGGTLGVQTESNCGLGGSKSISLVQKAPRTVSAITGVKDPCPYMQSAENPSGTLVTYTINKVAEASSYIWAVPVGATIMSHPGGAGFNDTIITVIYSSSFVSGAVTVQGVNFCGATSVRTLLVARKPANTPGTITGPTSVCGYKQSPSNPSGTPVDYTIKKVLYATSYTWTIPANATATHPGGTGINDTILRVTYLSNFNGGVVTVKANTNCNTSAARSLSIIYKLPYTPGTITASAPTACPQRRVTYSIASVPNYATSVLWTAPASGVIISGQGTTSIIVEYSGATLATDSIKVVGVSDCGVSSQRKLKVGLLPSCRPAGNDLPIVDVRKPVKSEIIPVEMKLTSTPNPSAQYFTCMITGAEKNKSIYMQVLDAAGRIVEKKTWMANDAPLVLGSTWKAGTYFLLVVQGDKRVKLTLIKL